MLIYSVYPLTTDWVISEEIWYIVSYFDRDLLPPKSTRAEIDEWYNSLVDLNRSIGMLGNQQTSLESKQFFLLSFFSFPSQQWDECFESMFAVFCEIAKCWRCSVLQMPTICSAQWKFVPSMRVSSKNVWQKQSCARSVPQRCEVLEGFLVTVCSVLLLRVWGLR